MMQYYFNKKKNDYSNLLLSMFSFLLGFLLFILISFLYKGIRFTTIQIFCIVGAILMCIGYIIYAYIYNSQKVRSLNNIKLIIKNNDVYRILNKHIYTNLEENPKEDYYKCLYLSYARAIAVINPQGFRYIDMIVRANIFNISNPHLDEIKNTIENYILDIYKLNDKLFNEEIDINFYTDKLESKTNAFWTFLDKEYLNYNLN